MSHRGDQQRIVDWFDRVYARRGARYLRPVSAYRIFPALLGILEGERLLDVSCGPGVLLQTAHAQTRHLHGCDISRVAVSQARQRTPQAGVLVANAEALPYRSGTFDVILCLGSLERMLDRSRALREMARVGVPRARYCFLVRNANTRRWKYLSSARARQPTEGHMDADTLENWTKLFRFAGFRVTRVLSDQYPLLRRQVWRRMCLGAAHFRTVAASRAPLERANAFVFLLEKQP